MLDEGLGNGDVDVVVGHVVADAVSAPTEGEFAEVAGAEDKGVVEVGEAEEMAGAFASLDVFEGDVVLLFAVGEGVFDVAEHLEAGGLNVDFGAGDAEGLHEFVGVAMGEVAGGETGHGVGENVCAGKF